MVDPVSSLDKVVVVAVTAEKQDMLVYIIAHVMWTLLRYIIFEI